MSQSIYRINSDAGAAGTLISFPHRGQTSPRPLIHKVVSRISAYMPPLILHSQAPQPEPNPPRSCTKHKMVLYIRLKRN